MNRKYKITTALLALVVAVSIAALATPVAAQSGSIDDTDFAEDLSEVDVDVTIEDATTSATVVLESDDFEIDIQDSEDYSPSEDGNTAAFGLPEDGQYTVTADLTGAEDGDELSVDLDVEGVDVDSATFTAGDEPGPTPPPTTGDEGDRGEQRDTTELAPLGQEVVDPGAIDEVFLGEAVEFTETLVGQAEGGAEGEVLDDGPIPANQETGVYEGQTSGDTVVVRTPRVQELEVINRNGQDVVEAEEDVPLLVGVDYNYGAAEPIVLELFESGGGEVTGEYVTDDFGALTGAQDDELDEYDARWVVEFDTADDYELDVGPDGDGDVEDVEDAVEQEVLTIVSEDDEELELEQVEAFQGERVQYEITNGEDGDSFFVAIEADEARDEQNPDERVFRFFEDTEDRGLYNEDTGNTNAAPGDATHFWARKLR